MRLGRREYNTPRGKFTGYISADTNHFDGIWLRDWIHGLAGYKHWEMDMQCGLDRFLEAQGENGQIPHGIERSGKTWRVGLESDVEYILTLGVRQTWQVTRDDDGIPRIASSNASTVATPGITTTTATQRIPESPAGRWRTTARPPTSASR
jgi:hypothetical protein